MTTTVQATDQPTFTITEEIFVQASIDTTFASIVTQLGRQNQGLDGSPMPMIFEPKPGGRWYRDLGEDNGHFWGFVQAIKKPSLLEIWGPMFMSTGTTNNVQYRLSEQNGGTMIEFKHTLVGPVPDEFRERTKSGWTNVHARIKNHAEAAKA